MWDGVERKADSEGRRLCRTMAWTEVPAAGMRASQSVPGPPSARRRSGHLVAGDEAAIPRDSTLISGLSTSSAWEGGEHSGNKLRAQPQADGSGRGGGGAAPNRSTHSNRWAPASAADSAGSAAAAAMEPDQLGGTQCGHGRGAMPGQRRFDHGRAGGGPGGGEAEAKLLLLPLLRLRYARAAVGVSRLVRLAACGLLRCVAPPCGCFRHPMQLCRAPVCRREVSFKLAVRRG
jgi:hypothetical protein